MVIKINVDFEKKPLTPYVTIDGKERNDIVSIDGWIEDENYGKGEWIDDSTFCLKIPAKYVFLKDGRLGFEKKKATL